MLNDYCITTEEWAEYISTSGKELSKDFLELAKRVHAHIGSCPKCRALYEVYNRAEDALTEYLNIADSCGEQGAYLAVASDSIEEAFDVLGELSISIRMNGGKGRFCLDTLDVSGACERYRFEPQNFGSSLIHAGNANTWMRIADGRLHLSFPEYGGVQVEAELIGDDGEIESIECTGDGCGQLELSENGSYSLQLTLVPARPEEKNTNR